MVMAADPPDEILKFTPRHFHISAPNLGPVRDDAVDYHAFASALRRTGYENFVSIEMRPEKEGNLARAVRAIELGQRVFAEA
jgi:sugar phosphate isomerase/epimerase